VGKLTLDRLLDRRGEICIWFRASGEVVEFCFKVSHLPAGHDGTIWVASGAAAVTVVCPMSVGLTLPPAHANWIAHQSPLA